MRPTSREESLSSGSPPSDVEHYDSATTFQLPKPVVENRIQALSERYGVPFYKRDPHMGLNECCRSIVSRANEESQSPVTCTLSLPDMNCVWALLRQAFCDKSVLPQLFLVHRIIHLTSLLARLRCCCASGSCGSFRNQRNP